MWIYRMILSNKLSNWRIVGGVAVRPNYSRGRIELLFQSLLLIIDWFCLTQDSSLIFFWKYSPLHSCLCIHVRFVVYYGISLQFWQEFNDIITILIYFIEILHEFKMIYWVLLILNLGPIAFMMIVIVQNDKWKAMDNYD